MTLAVAEALTPNKPNHPVLGLCGANMLIFPDKRSWHLARCASLGLTGVWRWGGGGGRVWSRDTLLYGGVGGGGE